MPTRPNILVVDDNIEQCKILEEVLVKEGYVVTIAVSGEEAAQLGQDIFYDVVISDIRMLQMDGLALLRKFKQTSPATIVILMTAFGSLETALQAMRDGAFDYISKPFRLDEIKTIIKRAIEQKQMLTQEKGHKDSAALYDPNNIIGQSKIMNEVYKTVALAAKTDATVLLQGESGTGKELIARAIHHNSNRAASLFLAINCAAIPEGLLESELFGHKKGAFTGAVEEKVGLFEKAAKGTILLDEIGDTTSSFQSKLLRVLEEQEIKRVGGTENIKIDVRIIAASNMNLRELIKGKQFRDDLFYRLTVITIDLPPLRERGEDIELLSGYFLKKYDVKFGKNIVSFSDDVMNIFRRYKWPGNVREMEHVVERAVALTSGVVILPQDLPTNVAQLQEVSDLHQTLDEMEKNYILQILYDTKGNRSKAADILGIDRKTLYRKALKYGIDIDGIA